MTTTLEQIEKIRDIAVEKISLISKMASEKIELLIGAVEKAVQKEETTADHELEVAVVTEKEPEKEKAHEAVAVKKSRAGRNGGQNKSQLVREYVSSNRQARNMEIVAHFKSEGIKVPASLVSLIKKEFHPSPKTGKVKAKAKKVENISGLPMPAMVARCLKGHADGVKLKELALLVKRAGYKYGGDKGDLGIAQGVYQALYSLSQKKAHPGWVGETAVVLHDAGSKRWRLNPRAKVAS